MIGTAEINKLIRKTISPILRESGFSVVKTRNNWGYHDHCIWVLNIGAVGNYFSGVTGWPSSSLCVWLGIFYDFIPPLHKALKEDSEGNLLPHEYECQIRSNLEVIYDQSNFQIKLNNRAEHKRKDIWWIEPDGSNAEKVMEDIKRSFEKYGKKWFIDNSNLQKVYQEIINNGCYNKNYVTKYFAKYLGLKDEYEKYSRLDAPKKK